MFSQKNRPSVMQQRIMELEEQLAAVNKNLKLVKHTMHARHFSFFLFLLCSPQIRDKDEIIKLQNDTLNTVQIELQAMRNKESAVEHERNKRNQEIANLKQTIQELEEALKDMRERSHNLQKAVSFLCLRFHSCAFYCFYL